MEKDKYELLEECMNEFVDKLDKIGFDVLGGEGNNSIEIEIIERAVNKQCPCMKEKSLNCGMKCSNCGREL
ncbi:hypothetical protein H7E67_01285 [Clostridium gasigenes]|uniref:hypothetical protein n=1 Tax=Clostridium gasigenes TaxID=94869 RepID=UPI001627634F|nr:hypothetical protein [Clostridium gasigenes]MBB6622052.1 hypothetical protein [Clostridium gasigenes]